ncbi:hypothetical protein [Burkholderia anthina]|uniref:hypothetical protein n=1 Tax=Burkholderia anthina TaxID=179879 RepID=UPI001AA061D3|nr:hypothetical protein [Burkholderia anthina]QTD88783.1 hypothetical protein J4G50_13255 [Burkholderia anthina]
MTQEQSPLPTFRLTFEYVDASGDTLRSTQVVSPPDLQRMRDPGSHIASLAVNLHQKIVAAMKDDGYIEPPNNVIKVDFQRRKRV